MAIVRDIKIQPGVWNVCVIDLQNKAVQFSWALKEIRDKTTTGARHSMLQVYCVYRKEKWHVLCCVMRGRYMVRAHSELALGYNQQVTNSYDPNNMVEMLIAMDNCYLQGFDHIKSYCACSDVAIILRKGWQVLFLVLFAAYCILRGYIICRSVITLSSHFYILQPEISQGLVSL